MRVSVGGGILQGDSVDLAAGRKAAALARRTRQLEKKITQIVSSILQLLLARTGTGPMLPSPRYASLQG